MILAWLIGGVAVLTIAGVTVLGILNAGPPQDLNTVSAAPAHLEPAPAALPEPDPAPAALVTSDAPVDGPIAGLSGEIFEDAFGEDWDLPLPLEPGQAGHDAVLIDPGPDLDGAVRLLQAMRPDLDLDAALAAIEAPPPYVVFRNLPMDYGERVRAAFESLGARLELH